MTMLRLAEEYRKSAQMIKSRIDELKAKLLSSRCETEKYKLRSRIADLSHIMRETNETAVFLERYYNKEYHKNDRFTI